MVPARSATGTRPLITFPAERNFFDKLKATTLWSHISFVKSKLSVQKYFTVWPGGCKKTPSLRPKLKGKMSNVFETRKQET